MPLVMMAVWFWRPPYDDNDKLTFYQIITLPLLIIILPILLIIDIITFPFHCLNIIYRIYNNIPYNGDYYWYEYILRDNPNLDNYYDQESFYDLDNLI